MNSDALRQWVADQTGLTTIWMNPNAPRPPRPYCAIQIINVARIGEPYRTGPDVNGFSTITADREAVVSIQVFESASNPDPRSALETATDLRDTLELITVRAKLADAGWAVRAFELLTDAPQLLETQFEPRAIFDVRFGTTKELLEDVGLIESIEVTGAVRDTDYTATFTAEV